MHGSNANKPGDALARASADRRRFRRVRIDLPGRLYTPTDSREAECMVVDLSPGGAQVQCDLEPGVTTPVILYVERFGRFEGLVTRRDEFGFGIRFSGTAMKRERTAEQLTAFLNDGLLGEHEVRRHERTPTSGLARFTRHDGSVIKCEVLDLSTGGVSLKTGVRPQVGEFVLIGHLAGRVARHHADGIGVEFVGLGAEKPTTDHLHASITR